MKKSMNIHRRYVPDWGPWEIARELISNSIDACGDEYKLDCPNGNHLKITTPTHPTMSQMLHVGSGSKTQDSDEIGIFGEGFKLAILVATRSGMITCYTQEGLMTFSFEQEYGEEVLHVNIDESKKSDEFIIDVHVPGIGADIHSKILPNRKAACMSKSNLQSVRIFHKGIWVADLKHVHALWDWNLDVLNINRDRNLVSSEQINPFVRKFIMEKGSQDMWEDIFRDLDPAVRASKVDSARTEEMFSGLTMPFTDMPPSMMDYSMEATALFSDPAAFRDQSPQEAYDAFFAVYGKKGVVCDKFATKQAVAVAERGYTPVFGPCSFEMSCRKLGLPLAKDILGNENSYEPVEVEFDDQNTITKMQKYLRSFQISCKIVPCVLKEFGKELTYDEAFDQELEVDRVMFDGPKKLLVPYFESRGVSDLFGLIFSANDSRGYLSNGAGKKSYEIAGELAAKAMESEYDSGY